MCNIFRVDACRQNTVLTVLSDGDILPAVLFDPEQGANLQFSALHQLFPKNIVVPTRGAYY